MIYTERASAGERTPEKNKKARTAKALASGALAFAMAIAMAGCSGSGTGAGEGSADANAESERPEVDLTFTDRDMDPSYDESSATLVTLTGNGATIDGEGAIADGTTITFAQEATYIVSGELDDGQLVVDAGDQDKLQIVLAGASVHNSSGPALLVSNADKVFLTLADGSVNAISDGTEYATGEDDNSDGAIFSRDDLTINGSGALEVNGNYKHAVVSKDDLRITGGQFAVVAVEDAFQGKNALKISDGNFSVEAGNDAFHSEYLFYAKGGSIDVITCVEGYEAEKVIVDGGEHSIYATDDALNAAAAESDTTDGTSSSTSALDAAAPQGMSPQSQPDGSAGQNAPQMPNGGDAGKGMRDDMPGKGSDMNGGPDDMPEDMQGGGGRGGEAMPESSSECLIQINGGTLNIVGLADALDSNGNIEINGGTLLVCGPSQGMDGAFTFDLEAQINGGEMLMLGSMDSTQGMDSSEQAWSVVQASGKAGSTVELLDASGNMLLSMQAALDFSEAIVSSASIAYGSAYSIQIDGSQAEFTMSEDHSNVGSVGMNDRAGDPPKDQPDGNLSRKL